MEKVKTAVLSTTARANARAKAREQEKAAADGEAMETVSRCSDRVCARDPASDSLYITG